jgi:superfamily II DNA or RNA helicase
VTFAELSVSAAQKQPEQLDDLAGFLGLAREHLDTWLEAVHGRTKLPKAFGRLWPANPDEARERLPMADEFGELRVSDARQDPQLRLQLAQMLGVPLNVVEESLLQEHHRSRLDRCGFESCEQAYIGAVRRRSETSPSSTSPATVTALPAELASLRVSDARDDRDFIYQLADLLDISPNAVRRALELAHHRQRLDRVDFRPPSAEQLEISGLSPPPPATPPPAPSPSPQPKQRVTPTYVVPEPSRFVAEDAGLTRPFQARPLTVVRSGTIAPGAHIELRDAVWRVVRIDHTSAGTQAWRCVGVSEIVRDQEAVFLEEYEPDIRVLDPRETRLVRDTSPQHRAGLLYMESLLRDVPPPNDALYVGHKAAMDALKYQLEPAWMALQKPRQRILIADAVGLGKTLEAGILLSELIRRGRARRILVCTTKAMLTQFQKEMWARFSIPLVRLDSVGLQRVRAELPTHHNPFYFYDRAIISIDTLKQNNWFRTHVEQAHWDVIVIDEAHNVAVRGSNTSMRARVANLLARNCDSLVLLSATPHDGKAESFASLMNMLDPTAIANPSDYVKEDIEGLYVRRFKHDVADQLATRIPERKVMRAKAQASAAEEQAYEVLTELELPELDGQAQGGILFKTGLEKALFSSPAACLQQLRAPLRRKRLSDALPAALRREVNSEERLMPTSELLTRAVSHLEADPAVPDLLALRELALALEAIDPEDFSKYQKLLELLGSLHWKPTAKDDRLVIFTERRETLRFLEEQLVAELGLTEGQWEVLHGGLPDTEQQRIVEDFGKQKAKVRLLLASDVASEGINLHYLSHRMIHFDVPWSLMVFQQRNGRIDRYGQERTPQIVYLLTESDNEAIRGDNRILELLISKDEQAQKNIGDPSAFMNVFDVEEEEEMTALAIQDGDADSFAAKLDANIIDPLALLLAAANASASAGLETRDAPSLFAGDFEYMSMGVEHLQATQDLKAKIRAKDRIIELQLTDDLVRRYRRLPTEIRPTDGIALLTPDPGRMQQALADARKQDSTWPEHQLLWANSPMLQWLGDRMRSSFGRHSAPVLVVPLPGKGRRVFVVSGLLPNRRGQPLVHRWYAVHFEGMRFEEVQSFEDFLAATKFGRTALPNAQAPIDLEDLQALRAPAVAAVARRLEADRDAFRGELGPKLNTELERLQRLEARQLQHIEVQFAARRDVGAEHKRSQQERRVKSLFADYQTWMKDAMTVADKPFLQIIAALVGGAK